MTSAPDTRQPAWGQRPLLVLAALGLLGFLAMLVAVETPWSHIKHWDRAAATYFGHMGQSSTAWVSGWRAVGWIFDPWAIRCYTLAAVAYLVARRRGDDKGRIRLLVFLGVGVLLGGLLPTLVKQLVGRPRPIDELVPLLDPSFPSGHAFAITVGVVAALILAHRRLPGGRFTAAVGCLLIALVCFSRVALAVHYPSDVVAGSSLGLAWICLVAVAVERAT